MYRITLQKNYDLARKEGRLCPQCGGIILKYNWKKGFRICWFCYDANKGVNVSCGSEKPVEEIVDVTGEE